MTLNSSDSAVAGSGTAPAASNSVPLWTSSVASPPSSRIMFGPSPSGQAQRLLGAPPVLLERLALPGEDRDALRVLGRALGADGDRGGGVVLRREDVARAPSAPRRRARRASRSAPRSGSSCAASPMMRAPLSGCAAAYSSRIDIRPGISCSARRISLRPNSASERSATLKSVSVESGGRRHAVSIGSVSVAAASSALVLLLLPAQPVVGGDVSGRRGSASNHSSTARAQLGVAAQAQREADVREAELEARRAARAASAGAAARAGAVQAVAGLASARGSTQPAALDVAQHPRRPAGRLGRLVDRQRVHRRPNLTTLCQGLARRALLVRSASAPSASSIAGDRRRDRRRERPPGRARRGRRAGRARRRARPSSRPRVGTRCVPAASAAISSRGQLDPLGRSRGMDVAVVEEDRAEAAEPRGAAPARRSRCGRAPAARARRPAILAFSLICVFQR